MPRNLLGNLLQIVENNVFLFYTCFSKEVYGQKEMYFKKTRDIFIQYIMAYKNLLQFLKLHHGLGDISSVSRHIFQIKTGEICKKLRSYKGWNDCVFSSYGFWYDEINFILSFCTFSNFHFRKFWTKLLTQQFRSTDSVKRVKSATKLLEQIFSLFLIKFWREKSWIMIWNF